MSGQLTNTQKERQMSLKASDITFLIVDDEVLLRRATERTLSAHGYLRKNIHTAFNGNDGLCSALKHNPKVVITDYEMPGMKGVEMALKIVEEMRRRKKNPPPFIFVSGHDKHIVRSAALKLLGDKYSIKVLVKPVEPAALIAAIKEVTKA